VKGKSFFQKHIFTILLFLFVAFLLYLYFKPRIDYFPEKKFSLAKATTRGDSTKKNIALVFTAHEFGDGADFIAKTLRIKKIKASFFFTGDFYRNEAFTDFIRELKSDSNYLGSHSDKHLLYCDWTKRDSLLVTKKEFIDDLLNSYHELSKFGVEKKNARYFLPPYEWYNDSIVKWNAELFLRLINFTPGTRSTADYTYPEMGSRYVSSDTIFHSILEYERRSASGLNGFILLIHLGTDPRRKDKFYSYLPQLIDELRKRGYAFLPIDKLL